jgi:hypothetical protein
MRSEGHLTSAISNPMSPDKKIFLSFDPVHNFKNVFNNFLSKKEFIYLPFLGNPIGKPNAFHVETIYKLEQGKSIKMAHSLSKKVLHPTAIEKISVKLADAFYHKSTIAALEFYSDNGYPEFKDTFSFLKLICYAWNICNMRTPNIGQHKRDWTKNPMSADNVQSETFLRNFHTWLGEWQSSCGKKGLSRETFMASKQTTLAFIELSSYLTETKGFKYFLPGQAQSDPLEERFSAYRQPYVFATSEVDLMLICQKVHLKI